MIERQFQMRIPKKYLKKYLNKYLKKDIYLQKKGKQLLIIWFLA